MLVRANEKVYWYPYWGAFYWMSYGRVIFAIDKGYSTVEADIVDPLLDPCQADAPLFGCDGLTDADCFSIIKYDMTTTAGDDPIVTFMDHVWVYRFLYGVINWAPGSALEDYTNIIIKISGKPDLNDLDMDPHNIIWLGTDIVILRMQSLE